MEALAGIGPERWMEGWKHLAVSKEHWVGTLVEAQTEFVVGTPFKFMAGGAAPLEEHPADSEEDLHGGDGALVADGHQDEADPVDET